jgi:hypothetical protein
MMKLLFAAAAAFALVVAAPAFAACPDCKDCPNKMAAADTAEKKDAPACACGDAKECKCPAKCECPHCHAKKAEKEGQPQKT